MSLRASEHDTRITGPEAVGSTSRLPICPSMHEPHEKASQTQHLLVDNEFVCLDQDGALVPCVHKHRPVSLGNKQRLRNVTLLYYHITSHHITSHHITPHPYLAPSSVHVCNAEDPAVGSQPMMQYFLSRSRQSLHTHHTNATVMRALLGEYGWSDRSQSTANTWHTPKLLSVTTWFWWEI